MKKNNKISEQYIINNFLKKLHFNKKEAYDFNNDAGFINFNTKKQLIVTNDTIIESIDFFKNDPPESIAIKIVNCNLSDVSAMGALPYAYTLSLCLPKNVNYNWLTRFTKKLKFLQKKYNFFLIGGDLSQTNKIIVSANFFGLADKGKILTRTGTKINDEIWISGNIGESTIGLKIKQKKIKINNYYKKYFIDKYLYPTHSLLGEKIINYATSAIDISDGFFGDLSKLIKHNDYGASIVTNCIPFSNKAKHLIKKRKININTLLSSGDDYQLIFTANSKNSSIIKRICMKNNIKISNIGKIIRKKGIYLDNKKLKIINKSFEHFS